MSHRSDRHRRHRLGAVAALLLGTFAFAAPALAASPGKHPAGAKRTHIAILAPKGNSQPWAGSVTAKVRVEGGHFRAYLNGKNVTSSFRGKRIRTATFEPGKVLRPGEAGLLVIAGKGDTASIDSSHFFVRKNAPGSLTLKVRRGGRYVAPYVRIRGKAEMRRGKVWLNGKQVTGWLNEDPYYKGLEGRLPSADLTFGSNTVKVSYLGENGTYATRSVSFSVSKKQPIADAGKDRRVGVGGRAMLNGAGSRPPLLTLIPAKDEAKAKSKGKARGAGASASRVAATASSFAGEGELKYRWKLIEAPQGSEAKILEPAAEEAELIPDIPGEYLAELTVTAPNGSKTVDDVSIESPGSASPMGMPIQTITSTGAIQIGDPGPTKVTYQPAEAGGPKYETVGGVEPNGSQTYPRNSTWIQMLVLDGGTGAPVNGEQPYDKHSGVKEATFGDLGFEPGQGGKLVEAIKSVPEGALVVLSGQGLTVSIGKSDQADLKQAFELLGGTLSTEGTTPQGAADLANGNWSLIGHPGLTPGGAEQNFDHQEQGIKGFIGGSMGGSGSLNGYLQSAVASLGFQFISPEVTSIDTKWTANLEEAPSPAQNTIKVGEQKYVSQPINTGDIAGCPCSVGIQVLYLDPTSLVATSVGTFGVLKMDGETNFEGIHDLDAELHGGIADHEAGADSLVVVQDFGSWLNANWPGGNSTDWLQDTLPRNEYTPWWKAKTFPGKPSQLKVSWNQANKYGLGSVAGNLGDLVSPGFHDVVANYRRPVYEPLAGKVIPRVWGGLTAIASTNLFDKSSAFGSGQGTVRPLNNNPLFNNGRVTGALIRNSQSQWELSGGAAGAGIPDATENAPADAPANEFESAALPELVNGPQSPWTCTKAEPKPCSGTGAELEAAMTYLSTSLPLVGEGRVTNIRNEFEKTNFGWEHLSTKMEQVPCEKTAGYTAATCKELRTLLARELEYVGAVEKDFATLTKMITGTETTLPAALNEGMKAVLGEVASAKRNLVKEKAKFSPHEWIEQALQVGSAVMGVVALAAGPEVPGLALAPSAITAATNVFKAADLAASFFEKKKPKTAEVVPDNTSLIRDRTSNLIGDLQATITNAKMTLGHYEEILRDDPVKLKTAAVYFGGRWSMSRQSELRFQQALVMGADQSLYEAIMPMAFNQWIFSPRTTSTNEDGPVELPSRGYNCTYQNEEGYAEGFLFPLKNEPADMSGMSSVGWSAAPAGPQLTYTVRALKAKDDDLELEAAEREGEYGNNLIHRTGTAPKETLMKKLFEPISPLSTTYSPQTLELNKEMFFGLEGWKLRQIQCGFANN